MRVLEYGQFEKVGSDTTINADCRLIAATNRDLKKLMGEGKFREDLFYRLNVIGIAVPPLRERLEDIPALISYFMCVQGVEKEYEISSDALGLAASFEWPGNIRQLNNFIQQLLFECESGVVGSDDVRRVMESQQNSDLISAKDGGNRLHAAIRQFETGYLSQLHIKHNGNIAAMARELGMDRGNLSKKLKLLGIV